LPAAATAHWCPAGCDIVEPPSCRPRWAGVRNSIKSRSGRNSAHLWLLFFFVLIERDITWPVESRFFHELRIFARSSISGTLFADGLCQFQSCGQSGKMSKVVNSSHVALRNATRWLFVCACATAVLNSSPKVRGPEEADCSIRSAARILAERTRRLSPAILAKRTQDTPPSLLAKQTRGDPRSGALGRTNPTLSRFWFGVGARHASPLPILMRCAATSRMANNFTDSKSKVAFAN